MLDYWLTDYWEKPPLAAVSHAPELMSAFSYRRGREMAGKPMAGGMAADEREEKEIETRSAEQSAGRRNPSD